VQFLFGRLKMLIKWSVRPWVMTS